MLRNIFQAHKLQLQCSDGAYLDAGAGVAMIPRHVDNLCLPTRPYTTMQCMACKVTFWRSCILIVILKFQVTAVSELINCFDPGCLHREGSGSFDDTARNGLGANQLYRFLELLIHDANRDCKSAIVICAFPVSFRSDNAADVSEVCDGMDLLPLGYLD